MKKRYLMKYHIILLLCTLSSFSASSQTKSDTLDYFICTFSPPPEFPGGFDSLKTFIHNNIGREIANDCEGGIVYVQFMVDEYGAISHVKVMKGLAKACDEEAVRIVKSMPTWKPAHQWGKPLKVVITWSVRFYRLK